MKREVKNESCGIIIFLHISMVTVWLLTTIHLLCTMYPTWLGTDRSGLYMYVIGNQVQDQNPKSELTTRLGSQ